MIGKLKSYREIKPPPGAEINWGNPLCDGLTFLSLHNEGGGTPTDLVTRRRANNTVSLTGWGVGPGGRTPSFTTSSCYWYERDTMIETRSITAVAFLRRTGTLGSYARAFGKTYNNGASSPYLSYDIEYNTAGEGQNKARCNIYTSGGFYGSGAYTIPDETVPHLIGVSYNPEDLICNLHYNGVKVANTPAIGGGALSYDTSTGGRFIVGGGAYNSGGSWVGDIYWVAIWNRRLLQSEWDELYRNPYCMLVAPIVPYMDTISTAAPLFGKRRMGLVN